MDSRAFEDVALTTYDPVLLPPKGWQKVRGAAALAWGSFLWFLAVMLVSAGAALCVQSLSASDADSSTMLVSLNAPSLARSAMVAPKQTGYIVAERSESSMERRANAVVMNSVMKKPDLSDPKLRAKLAKGMGHNYYGEPAWPNDLLYMFPVCILGTIAACFGLATMEPTAIGEPANPFATPLEILPEWYFYPTFNLLRVIPNKLLGVLSMAAVPVGLVAVPFIENVNKFQNPFRRPVATSVFLLGTVVAIWLGIGATLPIDKAISLGFW